MLGCMYILKLWFSPFICPEGFPGSSAGKELNSVSLSGKSTGEGIGYPYQYSWTFPVAQTVKNPLIMQETWVWSQVGKIPWRREWLPTPVFWPGKFHGQSSLLGCSPWGRRVRHDWSDWRVGTQHSSKLGDAAQDRSIRGRGRFTAQTSTGYLLPLITAQLPSRS